ncbi:MAG: sodium:proton antiporter [Acidobacteriota bacterium]|jgi:Na+/H+ antiporter NhaD/arsenite permease-like protein|nr:sodium:proton antiporter [Acidobacteriota bacterium]
MHEVASFPLWSIVPFAAMLLSIAVLPLVFPKLWHSNRNKFLLSIGLSVPVLAILLTHSQMTLLGHSMMEYFSFIVLLGALFIISGGIHIRGSWAGTPLVNTTYLAVGAVLANLIGTTGASMLLIRPYLRANHKRRKQTHLIVFFIFIVSNIGGLLTPLGDPPLFLGFLRGVPFFWTLKLLPDWAFAVGVLLVLFNIVDQKIFEKEDVETPGALIEDVQPGRKLVIDGKMNFLCLLGVMVAAPLAAHFQWPHGVQESIMILMALISYFGTRKEVHKANQFDFEPIAEVAALFLGIFVTMIPALEILSQQSANWKLDHAWQFFWMTGALSSFLDNAPTYLTFTALASGHFGGSAQDLSLLLNSPQSEQMLRAISCGAVFMGANTYIGNGPNLMVKSIADQSGIKMPTFGGYLVYSASILIPLFIVITLIFFR